MTDEGRGQAVRDGEGGGRKDTVNMLLRVDARANNMHKMHANYGKHKRGGGGGVIRSSSLPQRFWGADV